MAGKDAQEEIRELLARWDSAGIELGPEKPPHGAGDAYQGVIALLILLAVLLYCVYRATDTGQDTASHSTVAARTAEAKR